MPYALLVLSTLALAVSQASARPGDVDHAFGHGGIASALLEPTYRDTAFKSVTAEPDGGVLAVRDGLTWRYLSNGSLDPGFPPRVVPAPPPQPLEAVQPDGKRVVAELGFYGVSGKLTISQIVVSRFNANGGLDAGFGDGGVVELRTDYGIEDTWLRGVLAEESGRILVVTSSQLVKLSASGQLDSGYGAAGVVKLIGEIVGFRSLAGDKIVVAGSTCCRPESDFFAARYGPEGKPDPAFGGGDGVATADSGGADLSRAVLWEADGSVVVGGITTAILSGCDLEGNCRQAPALVRFTADGQSDPGFGAAGMVKLGALPGFVRIGVFGEVGVLALAGRPDGGVFAAGTTGPGGSVAFIAALDSTGRLDPGFGDGGIVRERDPQPSFQEAGPVVVTTDHKILVAGRTNAGEGLGAALLRYRPNGALDRSFASGAGFAWVPTPDKVTALSLDRRGNAILLSGESLLSRIDQDGEVDLSFGREGSVRFPSLPELKSIALSRGRILVAGQTSQDGAPHMLLFRAGPSGRLDQSFGRRGAVVLGFERRCPCGVRQLAVQPDGRILLAGYARRSLTLVRLLPNGRLDRSFGRRGRVTVRLRNRSEATAVAVQGGKILVAGWARGSGRAISLLLRYTGDGRLDRSFAKGGIAQVRAPLSAEPNRILPTRHRILLTRTGTGRPVLAYRRNGHLDRSFADGPGIGRPRDAGTTGALQRGNLILAWTTTEQDGSPRKIALQRLAGR